MQVIANREALNHSLTIATSVIASRTTKPVLQSVKLSATGEALIVSATDLEIGVRYIIRQVTVSETGEVVVPADELAQIVRESGDETLQIEGGQDRCQLRSRDSHFVLYASDPRDFPPVMELETSPDIEIQAGVLRTLIERTVYAAAKESTRYAINGVLWECKGRGFQLVATDGRRLAKATGVIESAGSGDATAIVPAKTMSVLLRLLTDPEAKVGLKFLPNQLVAVVGDATLSSALLEGTFPRYEDVLPRDCDKKAELAIGAFDSAVRRAALLTNEHSKGVRLSFRKGSLILSSRAPEKGEATITMPAKYDGEPIDIGFNPAFLTDPLRTLDAETITIEMKEPMRPGIMRVGEEFVYVVMPISLV